MLTFLKGSSSNIAIFAAILALGTTPVMAQESQGTPEAEDNPASGTDLGIIVVTAQKREQRLDDVGVTVNVLTGDDLKASGTETLVDLAGITPNVQIKNVLANSITNVSIRGIGLNDYAVNNNPAAGVYVDNIYLVSPAMLSFGMFDVERVEVLKGPQGDLYGRNTTAGAVNIISRKPSSTPELNIEAGYAKYQNWHVEAAAGGAISSTLSGRVAFQTVQQNSGWQTNYVTGERIGKTDRMNGRVQLEWEPSSSVNVLLSAHHGYNNSDVALYKSDNVLTTEEDQFANNPRVAGAGVDPRMKLKSTGVSATVDVDLSDNVSLTSISAYEYFSRFHQEDSDGTSVVFVDGTYNNKINQYSQELRLDYDGDVFDLTGGLYYSYDKVSTRDTFDAVSLLPLFGLAGNDLLGNSYRQRTNSYAGFLHGEWNFAPRFTLIGGLRYTKEEKTFDNATSFLCNEGVCNNLFDPVSNNYSTSNISGKIGLNFQVHDRTLLYASISRGFKSGGFQGQLTFDPTVLTPFGDEQLTAYELGIKSRIFSNLQFNAAIFNYDYKDMQLYGPLFDGPVGVLFGIVNVGDARVRGAEADLWWRPVEGMDIRLGAGTIDTEVTKSVVAGVSTGSVLPNSPKLTLNGMIRHKFELSDQMAADITFSGKYQSRTRFDIVRNPVEAIEGGYFTANGEIGLSLNENWRVALWGKNLFNKLYRTQSLETSVGWAYHYGPPRTFGVTLSYEM